MLVSVDDNGFIVRTSTGHGHLDQLDLYGRGRRIAVLPLMKDPDVRVSRASLADCQATH